ncbi:dolichyl-phosphate beta-glucosyltransferase-like [Acanthaster planci]|uniref:Dolichyl-phosphate beta-glucosyltransferase n=1 Tax=Acanthaster planci TaxID=133434 RepID=A0A8B7YG96_ACAPL|nr:dolichyl-phosphate beta-glucosyltransferase-like [Acanthaster planci]
MELTLLNLLQFVALGALVVFILAVIFVYMTTDPKPDMRRYDSENYFLDPTAENDQKRPFPSLRDESSLDLSVIVPSYNEELRLPVMLDEAIDFLENKQRGNETFTYEVIVVDDGSKDSTTKVALEYSKKYGTERVRVLTLAKNRGKGGAVRLGMLSARGKRVLFADADGATKFADLEKLEESLQEINPKKDNMAIVCGSRAHLQEESVAERSLFRTVLMYGFHFLVWFLCVRGVRDTQCGFKLMTRETAARLFTSLHVNRWAFDVELLYLAQALKIPITEVAVNWHEIDGSKMVPIFSWLQMGKDLLLIRLRYMLGVWRINDKVKLQ